MYLLGESIPLTTINTVGECLDCGDARRVREEEKRSKNLTKLMSDEDDAE